MTGVSEAVNRCGSEWPYREPHRGHSHRTWGAWRVGILDERCHMTLRTAVTEVCSEWLCLVVRAKTASVAEHAEHSPLTSREPVKVPIRGCPILLAYQLPLGQLKPETRRATCCLSCAFLARSVWFRPGCKTGLSTPRRRHRAPSIALPSHHQRTVSLKTASPSRRGLYPFQTTETMSGAISYTRL